MLNKDERQGKVDEVKGHIKQAVGTVTGNRALKTEGKVDVAVGKVESAFGKAVRTAEGAATAAVRKVRR